MEDENEKDSSDKVKDITGKIFKGGFKAGQNQVHEYCDDIFHPGKKVGNGVYCTPYIEHAENQAEILEINEELAEVLMDAGMQCNGCAAAHGVTLEEACDVH